MKTSVTRILPSLISTGAIVIGSLAVSGCSSPEVVTSNPPADEPSVEGDTGTLRAYLVTDGNALVPIEGFEVQGSTDVGDRLTAAGCGELVKAGEPGVRFRSGGRMPAPFVEWASAQIGGAPATARFTLVVASEESWKCGVQIDAPVLRSLALRSQEASPVRLSWDVRSEPKPIGPTELATPEGGETAIGLLLPAVQKVREASISDDDTTAALLLPAVQKVREAAARSSSAEYPLFPADVAPPPLEVDIDEEAFGERFDGAVGGETEIGILRLPASSSSSAPCIIVGGGNGGGPQAGGAGAGGGGAGKVSMQDFHFVVKLKTEAIGSSRTTMSAIPVAGFSLLPPLTEERLAAASARIDALLAAAEATLAIDEVSRLVTALKKQPSEGASAREKQQNLRAYWRGDVANGTVGMRTSFDPTLGAFLRRASDVEGLWAYSRLVTAARLFERLDTPEGRALPGADAARIAQGRALARAALRSADEAASPMLPGRLRTTNELAKHDYRAAYAAVAAMAEVADVLGPGGGPLEGVEPDEIDLALKAQAGVKVAAGDVDGDGRGFFVLLDQVLDAPKVTDEMLADLAAKSAALATALETLREATEARFAATTPAVK